MKRVLIIGFLLLGSGAKAQSIADLLQQLALNYQKLAGMKNGLSEMYRGYTVLTKGYNTVRDVSQGNFSLHQVFLDGLYVVSPTVRKYPKVRQIISDQAQLFGEYKSCWNACKNNNLLLVNELGYLNNVFDNLLSRSQDNLDALLLVMSDNKLRMSDAERLRLIDQLYEDGRTQLSFLRKVNEQTGALMRKRAAQNADRKVLQKLYEIN